MKRLADAEGEEHLSFTLKQVALEELLSEEQHLELDKVLLGDELDSSRIVDVIKGTKVGQGFKFLPRKLNELVKSLQIWLEELTETGRSDLRKKLIRYNGISSVVNFFNRQKLQKNRPKTDQFCLKKED